MDLPCFAIVRKNNEHDYYEHDCWEIMSMSDMMKYEQALDELKRLRCNGYPECYLISVTFIVGPNTDM
jgi:hypothetical protein